VFRAGFQKICKNICAIAATQNVYEKIIVDVFLNKRGKFEGSCDTKEIVSCDTMSHKTSEFSF
jgi:hypothetical protein